jgi:hypothetical protein
VKKPAKSRVRTTSKRASKLLTRKEYGAHRGITRQRVDRLIAQGRVPLTDDGLIDPVVADAQLEVTAPEAAKVNGNKPSPALEKLRLVQAARAESAKKILDLEYRRRKGELVVADESERFKERLLMDLRKAMVPIPDALALEMAQTSDPYMCRLLVWRAIWTPWCRLFDVEYNDPPTCISPAMHGSPECYVFDRAGQVVRAIWDSGSNPYDGRRWKYTTPPGGTWHLLEEAFDREGRPISLPVVVNGRIEGAPDMTHYEFTNDMGKRCRYTDPHGAQMPEVWDGSGWVDMRVFNRREQNGEARQR